MSKQTSKSFHLDNVGNILTERQRKKLARQNDKHSLHVINNGISVYGKTQKQQELIDAIYRDDQIFVLGPAGTGKTYVVSSLAAKFFAEGKISKIIITRPNVASGPQNGFFPGDLNEKMAPWVAPIVSVLKEKLGEHIYEIALKKENIEIVPFEVMRGRSFNDQMVILDEAQNVSLEEFKMFVTRIGERSKVVINGDVKQSDLGQKSGYQRMLQLAKKYNVSGTSLIEFSIDDCVRSGIVREWLHIFDKESI